MAWLVSALRRLRIEGLQTLGIAALVLFTAFAAAMTPRVLDRLGDDTLRSEIRAAPAAIRHIQLIEERRIAWTSDPYARIVSRGETLERGMPDGVRALFADRGFLVETPRWLVTTPGKPKSTMRFRFQPGAAERVTIVEGRLPEGTTGQVEIDGRVPGERIPVTAYEVAMSTLAADRLNVTVGETVALFADVDDRMASGHFDDAAAVVIVGTFEVTDPDDEFWLEDPALGTPAVRELSSENAFYDATALLADAGYDPLMRATAESELPMRYTWRYFVDAERFEGETADALLVDLRRLEARHPATIGPETYIDRPTTMRTGLRGLVEEQRAGWRSAESALTVAGIGPIVVAAAAVALVVLLASQRRRAALALARGRGASVAQVLAATVLEGLLIAVPTATLAVVAAVALIPNGPLLPTLVAAAIVVVATLVLLCYVSFPSVSGLAHDTSRQQVAVRSTRPRRLAAELLVIALAVGGMVLLRERGLRGASSSGELETTDPFIAAVPALAAVAAGLIAIRLFPLPMRLLAWLAAIRRDLVPVLAMRRATRGSAAIPVLLVLLGTATVAAFSSATLAHLDRAAELVAWQEVGAPYQVRTTAMRLPEDFDPAALPGVAAASPAYRAQVPVGNRGAPVQLLAVEPVTYAAVVRGTPAETAIPAEFAGTGSGPVPAIVSPNVGGRSERVEVGDVFELSVEGRRVQFRAVALAETFPGMPAQSPFTVVPQAPLAAALPVGRLPSTIAFLRAGDDAGPRVRETLAESGPSFVLEGRAEQTGALRDSPISRAVTAGVALASVVSALYAALAVAAALALAGSARALEMAHLRTLGLTRGEALRLGLSEHGPTVLVAFAAGVALGLFLFVFLKSGLGLAAIVGSTLDIPLQVELGQLALVLAGIVMIMVAGIGLSLALGARTTAAAAVRRGIE